MNQDNARTSVHREDCFLKLFKRRSSVGYGFALVSPRNETEPVNSDAASPQERFSPAQEARTEGCPAGARTSAGQLQCEADAHQVGRAP